jgi:hypothetical protein
MIEIRSISSENNQFKDNDRVCYCFGYSRHDIEKDYRENNGQSTILARIKSEKKAGKCNCAEKNPKGR